MASNVDVYEQVTDQVIAALEAGVAPWRKPWTGEDMPLSLSTKKPYRGINLFILAIAGMKYNSQWWGTFNAIKARGGHVNKGEKSTLVIFWKMVKGTDDETGKARMFPMLRYYRVFNAEQTTDLRVPTTEEVETVERDANTGAEAVIDGYFKRDGSPERTAGGDAWYSPSQDRVNLPHREQFPDLNAYYATAFHEITHSTGHSSRLDRDGMMEGHSFGDPWYAAEELTAEMGSAMLTGVTGITSTLPQSASYLAGWLKALRNDKKLVVQAAGKAQRAADLVLGTTFEERGEE